MSQAKPVLSPGLGQRIKYLAGRPLPADLRGWVRYDLTGPHAAIRHVVRTELMYSPIFVVFLLFPGELWIRGLMVLLGVLLSTFYTLSYMDQNRSRRLEVNGLPPDLKSERAQASTDRDRQDYEAVHRLEPPPRAPRTAPQLARKRNTF